VISGLLLAVAAAASPVALRGAPPLWSFSAHRLVCEIAWREMTPAVRGRVRAILAADGSGERFRDACTWADRVRDEPAGARYRTAHYVNVAPGSSGVDPARDCADTYCIVEAIADLRREVADTSLPGPRRSVALRFLAHFVADIHQPLHVAYESDRGGNLMPVRFRGRETNLHAVWDINLVQQAGLTLRDAQRLHEAITPDERAAWADLDPVAWASESFALVERQVYRGITPGAALGDDYVAANRVIVARRVVQAGYRLGLLLNRLLGS
jgi:hypothetical protein